LRKLTTIAAILAVSLVAVLPAVASAQPDEEDLPPGLSLEDLPEGLDEFGPPDEEEAEEDLPPDPLPEETPEEADEPGVAPTPPEGEPPPVASGNTPGSQAPKEKAPKDKAPKEKASGSSSGSPAKSGGGSGGGTKAKELPRTGGTDGVALLALGAGTLLVGGGGFLARRIISSVR
jgi:LPXTG-motif cell wall-anchored protein